MPATTEAPVTHREPSMAQVRNMVQSLGKDTAVEVVETHDDVIETAEPEQSEQHTEPATAPGSETQSEEVEEQLPRGVKKELAKQHSKQSEYDRLIAAERQRTQAKEQELQELRGKPGSEPDNKTTAPTKDARPTRPDWLTFPGSAEELRAAMDKYESDFLEWTSNQTRETVTKELTDRQIKEAEEKAVGAAIEKHGADFTSLMTTLAESTPEPFQKAISALENWDTVAVHLAKNEKERAALVAKFNESPLAAVAALGKLEDRLTTDAKPDKEPELELPKPLKAVAGGPRSAAPAFSFEKASMGEVRKYVNKALAK